jgi:hypothetical protein
LNDGVNEPWVNTLALAGAKNDPIQITVTRNGNIGGNSLDVLNRGGNSHRHRFGMEKE